MPTLRSFLDSTGATARVVVADDVQLVIDLFEFEPAAPLPALPLPEGHEVAGRVWLTAGGKKSPIPGLDLSLGVPTGIAGDAPGLFRKIAGGFHFYVVLADSQKTHFVFSQVQGAPGAFMVSARKEVQPDGSVRFVEDAGAAAPILASRGGEDRKSVV